MVSNSISMFKPYTRQTIRNAPQWSKLDKSLREAVDVVSLVLPFRVNQHVLDELIDWDNVPDDPIYRLTFPHQDMLRPQEFASLQSAIDAEAPKSSIDALVREVQSRMNPHPGGQLTHNVPFLDGIPLPGLQHKYPETVLFFPSAGQSCHAYCTFCFRWPQFVGVQDLKFNASSVDQLLEYLTHHREVTDILITGGDPLVMNARSLRAYIEPLLSPKLEHIRNIRIGTKAVAYWPQRFVSDGDADDLLKVFDLVVSSGRNLAIMGHYSHPREMQHPLAQEALRRIIRTGATVRVQAPIIRHVNDDPRAWVDLWTTSVRLGAVSYYMFVERDTGPSDYFRLPLAKAYETFQTAYKSVSGLARTVRGPSMSAFPGKVMVDGIVELAGEKVFALQFLQARNPDWVRRPFFAKYDPAASWLDQLEPAFGEKSFFFQSKTTSISSPEDEHGRLGAAASSWRIVQEAST
jgi:L-lysine 2,3-aminomutase